MSETIKLSHDFDHVQWDAWQAEAVKTLKSGTYDDALVRRSEDGLALGPLFALDHRQSGGFLARINATQNTGMPWQVDVWLDNPAIETANTDALADLVGGASALTLAIDPSGENGIAVRTRSDFERILSGVHVDMIRISLAPHTNLALAALACASLSDKTTLNLGLSPFCKSADQTLNWASDHRPHWNAFSLDARALHEGGATPVQELAGLAAMLAAAARIHGASVFDSLEINLAVEADAHQSLIKLRAARALIDNITKAYGRTNTAIPIKATTSGRMLSKMDPWSNMLRLSSAVFAGVCGGADHIICLPFTQPLGLATPFARRMARNLQLLFMDESHLGTVNDPAHGSYGHESLTHTLAEAAWAAFQDMESKGGWEDASVRSTLKAAIRKAHKDRVKSLKNQTRQMVGVNQYVKTDIRPAQVRKRPVLPKRANSAKRSAKIVRGGKFSGMINRLADGQMIAATAPKPWISPVRTSTAFETEGSA